MERESRCPTTRRGDGEKMKHEIEVRLRTRLSGDPIEARWECSCGRIGWWVHGRLTRHEAITPQRRALDGGERHVAAMERG